jgi:hypothetical protein
MSDVADFRVNPAAGRFDGSTTAGLAENMNGAEVRLAGYMTAQSR